MLAGVGVGLLELFRVKALERDLKNLSQPVESYLQVEAEILRLLRGSKVNQAVAFDMLFETLKNLVLGICLHIVNNMPDAQDAL
jgi:hypothetical protein